MKMNLPNRLTVLRLCLVPVLLAVGIIPETWIPKYVSYVILAVLFIGASLTDMLDGKIARKRGLVTDFGKFLDPIADKFMVIGAMFVILYRFENLQLIMIFSLLIVVFRELAVTAMRLVVSTGKNIVVAANILGKLKTVLQIVAISTAFLEPVLQNVIIKIYETTSGQVSAWNTDIVPLTWALMGFSVVMTLWSGANYIMAYWKYIDTDK